ncbi:uncharacterized protein LOC131028842 isoform X2 [Cryptomeria japonica]|uniref:uncharacterized protein LOC131028842 isoform X2 n=1 Tax=Cryptomeria japonica TaxID=3369 RepID=UPI0027DA28B7|nr:uncharacterized protein LOC131028842 isoform X2 [Cryptomeria japonica]
MKLIRNQCSLSRPLHYSLVSTQTRSHLLSINYRFCGTPHQNPKLICTSLTSNIQRKIRGNIEIDKWDVITNFTVHALQAEESGITRGEEETVCRVKLQTLDGCRLGIGIYPDFEYNAEGGGGDGVGENLSDGRVEIRFDVGSLYIPPLTYQTTKFLGLPLPPILSISILPQAFQGFMDQDTGGVKLQGKLLLPNAVPI